MIFDPATETFLRLQAKAELRKRRRAMRNSIAPSARAARSARIVERVTSDAVFTAARRVALFWPMLDRNEVDVRPIDRAARDQGKLVAYPLLKDDGDMVLLVADPSELDERGHGFAEPPDNAAAVDVDEGLLVIVPALAVDLNGQRIGYGKGYYDRLLAAIAPPAFALAVAYDFEIMAEVPVTEGDYAVDMVVTDVRSFRIAR
ncbi:MAG TPA: 5-formyltetrahydrofolate cyclo-ligase [Polyangiaceae bacterium]|nr:5-formyltetrahydrofolate cyclo-ligase [Polyangiaceae bacterium]